MQLINNNEFWCFIIEYPDKPDCKPRQAIAYSFWQYWQTLSGRKVEYFHATAGFSFGSNTNYNSELSQRQRHVEDRRLRHEFVYVVGAERGRG